MLGLIPSPEKIETVDLAEEAMGGTQTTFVGRQSFGHRPDSEILIQTNSSGYELENPAMKDPGYQSTKSFKLGGTIQGEEWAGKFPKVNEVVEPGSDGKITDQTASFTQQESQVNSPTLRKINLQRRKANFLSLTLGLRKQEMHQKRHRLKDLED